MPQQPKISIAQRALLENESGEAERAGRLTKAQLDLLTDLRAFRMFLPESMNGLGMELPEALRFQESMAQIDGSLGWTLTLCAGATLFAGFMEPSLAADLLADANACFGGSGACTGTADVEQGGFRINGFWKYATGAPHLTAFTANCRIRREGKELRDELGAPVIRSFVFLAEEVSIHRDWRTMGLCATAGDAFEVKNLWVASNRAFDISPQSARLSAPIFKYPFQPFAELTLAVNHVGMMAHFLTACRSIFQRRAARKGHADFYERLFQEAEKTFMLQRNSFYQAADESWQECLQTGTCREATLLRVAQESHVIARLVLEQAAHLFPYCGMEATKPESEVNRIWRDLFTASQHSLLRPIG